MKNKIHINQFYPCTHVSLGVELQYIVELGKYLSDFGSILSVDGVTFDDCLKVSRFWDYFRMAIESEWICDCNRKDVAITLTNPIDYTVEFKNVHLTEKAVQYDAKDFAMRRDDIAYAYKTPKESQISFKEKNDMFWIWSLDHEYVVNNTSLNSYGSDVIWVSFIAYVAVQRLMVGQPKNLMVEVSFSLSKTPMVLSTFILLQEETQCCTGWCYYTFAKNVDESTISHIGYTAWYAKGLEKGMLNRFYSSPEKLDMLKSLGLGVGDVCFLYERKAGQSLDYVKSIVGFHFAIIKEITDKDIILTVVNNKKTLMQGEKDYADFTMATKAIYEFNNPFKKQNQSVKKFALTDIGVEYCMHGEQYFITACNNDDYKEMWVGSDEWSPAKLLLPAIELVYWILKDYKYEFNEEHFLEMYMKGEKPLYTQFRNNGEVASEYYVRDSRRR